MLIKDMIKEYELYKLKQPLSLVELKDYIYSKYKKHTSSAAVRNILLDRDNNDLNYYSSYVRGVYLPFAAQNEEEVMVKYTGKKLFPVGRYLYATKLYTNQVFNKGSYIIFGPKFIHFNNREKLVTVNNYHYVSNLSKEQEDTLKIFLEVQAMIESPNSHSLVSDKRIDLKKIKDWYLNDYQNILKIMKVESFVNNDEFDTFSAFKEWNSLESFTGHKTFVGTIIEYNFLPKAFDFRIIGILETLIKIRGNHE